MAKKSAARTAAKPKSIWTKPLQADFQGLFKSLSKGVIHFTTGAWDKLAAETVDAISALGFEQDPRGLAWVLVQRSMTQAVFDLIGESSDLLRDVDETQTVRMAAALDRELAAQEIPLDKNFFNRPADLSLVPAMRKALEAWLTGCGLSDRDSAAIGARLPSYFVFALNDEWRKPGNTYEPILPEIETPFMIAGERAERWSCYAAWLDRQVNQRMFDESFGLQQVYVPLNAYFEKKQRDGLDGFAEP